MYQARQHGRPSKHAPPPQIAALMQQVRCTQLAAMAATASAHGTAIGLIDPLSIHERKQFCTLLKKINQEVL